MTASETTATQAKTTFEYAGNVKLNEGQQRNGEKKEIPSMLQNTNILKQAKGVLMYRLLPVNCTDETLKARQ